MIVDSEGAVLALTPPAKGVLEVWNKEREEGLLRKSLERAGREESVRLQLRSVSGILSIADAPPGLLVFRADKAADDAAEAPSVLTERLKDIVIHDLRALLQSLQASIERVAHAPSTGGTPVPSITRLQSQSASVMAHIDRVLSFATSQELDPLATEAVDLTELLEEVVRLLAPFAEQHGKTLRLSFKGSSAALTTHPLIVHELAQNMIGNAVKFGEGGAVEVVARRGPAEDVTIEVWQEGAAIPEQMLARLRSREPGKRFSGRRGQGLEVMQVCLALLGGTWDHDRDADRACLSARFRLPLATETVEVSKSASLEAGSPEEGRLRGLRVLLVEDDAITREWATLTLSAAGAIVTTSSSAEDALGQIRALSRPFDILLTDINLVGLDGLEFARHVSDLGEAQKAVPIIALSGDSREKTVAACRKAGMAGMIQKPVSGRKLIQIISSVVANTEKEGLWQHSSSEHTSFDGVVVLDEGTVKELREDLGTIEAKRFMENALKEAEVVLGALRNRGFTADTRPIVHSSVGSSGITGLAAVEGALRKVQATEGADTALDELAEAISVSRYCVQMDI